MREHRRPDDGARRSAVAGDRHPRGGGRLPRTNREAVVDGEPGAGGSGRGRRRSARQGVSGGNGIAHARQCAALDRLRVGRAVCAVLHPGDRSRSRDVRPGPGASGRRGGRAELPARGVAILDVAQQTPRSERPGGLGDRAGVGAAGVLRPAGPSLPQGAERRSGIPAGPCADVAARSAGGQVSRGGAAARGLSRCGGPVEDVAGCERGLRRVAHPIGRRPRGRFLYRRRRAAAGTQ